MIILIPMAGEGKRFADAGYTFPKPLIEVKGKMMRRMPPRRPRAHQKGSRVHRLTAADRKRIKNTTQALKNRLRNARYN